MKHRFIRITIFAVYFSSHIQIPPLAIATDSPGTLRESVGSKATDATPSQTTKAFYLTGHLGSTRVVTDGSGVEQARYAYYPYGEIYRPSPLRGEEWVEGKSSYLYTGKERDTETNLYYYGARYYDPQLGRFLSIDPLNIVTFDSYTYAQNNPIDYIDVDGNYAAAAVLPMLPGFGPLGWVIGIGIGVTILVYTNHQLQKKYRQTPGREATWIDAQTPPSLPTGPIGTKESISITQPLPTTLLNENDKEKEARIRFIKEQFLRMFDLPEQRRYLIEQWDNAKRTAANLINRTEHDAFDIEEHVDPSDFWDLKTPPPYSYGEQEAEKAFSIDDPAQATLDALLEGIASIHSDINYKRSMLERLARKKGKLDDPLVQDRLKSIENSLRQLRELKAEIKNRYNGPWFEDD